MNLLKIIIILVLLSSSINSQIFHINTKWSLLGTTENINDLSIFDNTCISKIFTYNKTWDSYYKGGTLKSLKEGQGFWAYTDNGCDINTKIISINKNTLYESCDYRSAVQYNDFDISNVRSIYLDKCYIYLRANDLLIYSKQDFSLINYISNVDKILNMDKNLIYFVLKNIGTYNSGDKIDYLEKVLAYNKETNLVKILDINSSHKHSTFKIDDDYIYYEKGKYSQDNRIDVLDKKTYKLLFSIIDKNTEIIYFEIYDSYIYVLYEGITKLKIFNKNDGKLVQIISLPDDIQPGFLLVSNNYIYIGGNTIIYSIDKKDVEKIQKIQGYKGFVSYIKVDNKYIYASSQDEIKIWDKEKKEFTDTFYAKPYLYESIPFFAPLDIDEHNLYYINKNSKIDTWRIK